MGYDPRPEEKTPESKIAVALHDEVGKAPQPGKDQAGTFQVGFAQVSTLTRQPRLLTQKEGLALIYPVVELLSLVAQDHPVAVHQGLGVNHTWLGAAQRPVIPG